MDPDTDEIVTITPAQLAAIHTLIAAARLTLPIINSHMAILESHGLHLPSVVEARDELTHALRSMSTDNHLPYTLPKGLER